MGSNNLVKYIVYRILLIIPTAIILFIVSFFLARLMAGGDIAATVYAGQQVPPEVLDLWREEHGFNEPILIQLWTTIKGYFQGDFGISYIVYKDVSVREILAYSIPRTIELMFIPTVIVPILGVKLGVISATHKNKTLDVLLRGFAVFGVSFPVYWIGLGLQYIFGSKLRLFTGGGYSMNTFGFKTVGFADPPFKTGFRIIDCILSNNMVLLWDTISHLILPVTCIIFISLSGLTRITRSSMLDVLEQDYIRTARAKGCQEKTVIYKHALRNAMIPTSTIIVMNIAGSMAGSFLIEITFTYKAMGYAFVKSMLTRDLYLIQACIMLIGIILLIGYVVADVLYTIIDPRISYN